MDEGSTMIWCQVHCGSVVEDGFVSGFLRLWGKIWRVWLVVLDAGIDDMQIGAAIW